MDELGLNPMIYIFLYNLNEKVFHFMNVKLNKVFILLITSKFKMSLTHQANSQTNYLQTHFDKLGAWIIEFLIDGSCICHQNSKLTIL